MQQPSPSPVSVFRFLDARDFLRRAYEAERRANRNFSQRYIARTLGAGSSSFFRDVLDGRASLTPARAAKFAKLFRLPPAEAEYFAELVLYTQAEGPEEKEMRLQKLTRMSSLGPQAVLEAFQAEYLKKWHYAAVRELLGLIDFRGDYAKLAALLEPAITEEEAENAVQVLLKLKLIRRNAQGRYERAEKNVSTGNGGDPAKARPGILANLELAQRALDAFPPAVRPFSYLTIGVSLETFAFVRDRLRAVRKEILEAATRDEEADRLYQLNLQFFPVSNPVKRRAS